MPDPSSSGPGAPRPPRSERSPRARSAEAWLRLLARTLKSALLYHASSSIAGQLRDDLWDTLRQGLEQHGAWSLRFTPNQVWLGDEPVAQPSDPATSGGREQSLAFLFYRDGIRRISFRTGIPRHDLDVLVEALLQVSRSGQAGDDLVTLLWLADLGHVDVESVPLEQHFYIADQPEGGDAGTPAGAGPAYHWAPTGGDLSAHLRQAVGTRGLHLDRVDDWSLPEASVAVAEVFPALATGVLASRAALQEEWRRECEVPFPEAVVALFTRLWASTPSGAMGSALASSASTWLLGTLQRGAWSESKRALELLRELDPEGSFTQSGVANALARFDAGPLVHSLDEAEPEEQARFLGVLGGLGPAAVGLACEILATASLPRTRAAACTVLSYVCGDEPERLAPVLLDPRPHLVRNIAFVLGQIGGHEVAGLLETATFHADPQVRRQAVQSLAAVPCEDHRPILLRLLGEGDPQLLGAALHLLSRDPDPEVGRAIAAAVEAPSFGARSDDARRALIVALTEIRGDQAVATLDGLLVKGGWFARRSLERDTAAHCLAQLGTPAALAALEEARRSRNEAIRGAATRALQGAEAA